MGKLANEQLDNLKFHIPKWQLELQAKLLLAKLKKEK